VTVLLVALGAAVGAPLGLFSGLAIDGDQLALLGTGFCGGLTTYSAFAVHTHDRGLELGSVNAVLTIGFSLACCALGFVIGQA